MAEGAQDRKIGLADTMVSDELHSAVAGRASADSVVGMELDHFLIERPLGAGGMGTVYVAHDMSLDRRVAIKMLRGELSKPKHQERLLHEARAQARLNHVNVVHIYYIGRRPAQDEASAGTLYLAMELVEGDSLEEKLEREGPLDPEIARRSMLDVARGLRAAHLAGIIHRDIKPSNLLCGRDGTIKIVDFGLAKPVESDGEARAEGVVGSPHYMAPEQARSRGVDHRSDLYALGATFYHLIAGSPPYEGETPLALIHQHLTSEVPSLRERAPGAPAALVRIVERLMAKDASRRFADYDELIAALEAAAPQATTYAGFWSRGAAAGIDGVVAGALIALLGWSGVLVHLAHVAVGHAWTGRTLAKYLLNMQVRRPDGTPLGLGRSLLRTVVSLWMPLLAGVMIALSQGIPQLKSVIERLKPHEMDQLQNLVVAVAISNGFLSLLYGAGLALAAFHPLKRALHDLLSDSVVVYRLKGVNPPGVGSSSRPP